jgi:hypothetical protein
LYGKQKQKFLAKSKLFQKFIARHGLFGCSHYNFLTGKKLCVGGPVSAKCFVFVSPPIRLHSTIDAVSETSVVDEKIPYFCGEFCKGLAENMLELKKIYCS